MTVRDFISILGDEATVTVFDCDGSIIGEANWRDTIPEKVLEATVARLAPSQWLNTYYVHTIEDAYEIEHGEPYEAHTDSGVSFKGCDERAGVIE